jgi:hypothetical protein
MIKSWLGVYILQATELMRERGRALIQALTRAKLEAVLRMRQLCDLIPP